MSASTASPVEQTIADADALADDGRLLDAVDLLAAANRERRDDRIEIRLAALRHAAYDTVVPASRHDRWPVPAEPDPDPTARIPQVAPADLSAEAVRQAILGHGSVHVPGLVPKDRVDELVAGIEHTLASRAELADKPMRRDGSWFASLALPRDAAVSLARNWVAGDGGILACDSPRLLDLMFRTYEEVGLKQVVTDYLGERPVLSANKCTLRRARLEGSTDWHQDGAFLGRGQKIRALNVWIALTDCGVDAPGMDIVPKRFHEVQETGTGGAIFDWAVGPETVATLSTDAPPVRPRYRAGDAMLFDDMLLHRTALDPAMTHTRHAIESWFFAPTDYPAGQVPLVW